METQRMAFAKDQLGFVEGIIKDLATLG